MKNLYKLSLVLLLTFLFLGLNCSEPTPPPPPNNGTLTLSVLETSCTEAWLELKTNGVAFPVNVNLLKDNTVAQTISLGKNDTTVYIDSLLPNKSYELQAQFSQSNQTTSSNKITVQTLDTTSSNFTWQTITFGDPSAGSSHLSDVAIVNENSIYAVGEIYMNDSTGHPDPVRYNAVHWDGNNWTVIRIPYLYQGQLYYNPIQTVFAFGASDIWFAGNGVLHWDGSQYVPIPLPTNVWGQDQINKIWGTSDNNLYIVGNSGSIAHYNGSIWTKIESGTTTNLNDIWGSTDASGSEELTLATVSSRYQRGDYKLLSVTSSNATDYLNWPYTRLYGLWFNSPRNIYIVGDGAYLYKNNNLQVINLPTNYFLTRVKGNGLNDIYIAGCCNTLIHFNGSNWQLINGVYGNYEGMDVRGNLVALAGFTGYQAIIIMLRGQ